MKRSDAMSFSVCVVTVSSVLYLIVTLYNIYHQNTKRDEEIERMQAISRELRESVDRLAHHVTIWRDELA